MSLPETFVPGFHDENEIRKLKYNELGTTGLKVSELSLGTGGFSYFYGRVVNTGSSIMIVGWGTQPITDTIKTMKKHLQSFWDSVECTETVRAAPYDYDVNECKKTVHEAIRRGINLIDTAPWYGHGVSEEILGKCLEGIPRKAYYLATKVCRYEKDPKLMFDFSAAKTKDSINTSLKRLRLEYVDILQVHDIEFAPSLDMVLTETLPTVEEIVKSGKARFIGITGYPVSTLLKCVEESSVKINTILSYCRLTMIDDTLKSFIPKFKANNIGIINAAANSMGLLSNAGPPEWHPASRHIKDVCKEAREYCKENDVELGKLAVYHSLQQVGPDTVLVGMNSTKLLDYNFNVVLNGLSQKEREIYENVLKIFSTQPKESHWENVELENYWKTIRGEGGSSGFF